MKESSPVFSAASVAVSTLILAFLVVFVLPPHPAALLPWSGALAGVNAVLLSFGLGNLSAGTRSALRWVGGLSALVLVVAALVKVGA